MAIVKMKHLRLVAMRAVSYTHLLERLWGDAQAVDLTQVLQPE